MRRWALCPLKWNLAYDSTQTESSGHLWFHGYKGWLGTVDYALQDNLGLSVYAGSKVNKI